MNDLEVVYKDKGIVINKRLLDIQDCWDNLPRLKELHLERLKLEELMEHTDDSVELKIYDKTIY